MGLQGLGLTTDRIDDLERIGQGLAANNASAKQIADAVRPLPKDEREVVLVTIEFEAGGTRVLEARNILAKEGEGLSTAAKVAIAGAGATALYLLFR